MYSLCALVGRCQSLRDRIEGHPDATLVRLEAGPGRIPLTEGLLQEVRRRRPEAVSSSRLGGAFEFPGAGVES